MSNERSPPISWPIQLAVPVYFSDVFLGWGGGDCLRRVLGLRFGCKLQCFTLCAAAWRIELLNTNTLTHPHTNNTATPYNRETGVVLTREH